jgi:hypothetical protein
MLAVKVFSVMDGAKMQVKPKTTVETLIHNREFKEKLYQMFNSLLELQQQLADLIFLLYVEET